MTIARLDAVGFCAHYSRQGDWAFDYALDLARKNSLQLNVFHFLDDPYDSSDPTGPKLSPEERDRQAIQLEKEMRMYYDPKLGDFLDVGFRLCEDREWNELHKCLMRREFQVLILGRPSAGSSFGGKPIEEFARSFVCPVVLVGPDSRRQYHLNPPAALIAGRLGLVSDSSTSEANTGLEMVGSTGVATPPQQLVS